MSDEEQIVAKPPSHPVATGLLVASTVGVGLNIAVVWNELFTSYLNLNIPKAVGKNDKRHDALKYAKNQKPVHDYFKIDFPTSRKIEDDLNLNEADGG